MPLSSYQQQFLAQSRPYAEAVARQTGLSPEFIQSQAALESNWGRSAPQNNYFGIKGVGASMPTREFQNGQWQTVNASFNPYSSMGDSFSSYGQYLTSHPRYKDVLAAGNDNAAAIDAMARSGYATDPNYGSKLRSTLSLITSSPINNNLQTSSNYYNGNSGKTNFPVSPSQSLPAFGNSLQSGLSPLIPGFGVNVNAGNPLLPAFSPSPPPSLINHPFLGRGDAENAVSAQSSQQFLNHPPHAESQAQVYTVPAAPADPYQEQENAQAEQQEMNEAYNGIGAMPAYSPISISE